MIHQREFYFIRHGQTDHNVNKTHADHIDISLNEKGRKQASDIEPIVTSLPIQTVCFSPLKRAKETKEIVTARLQAQHCEIADLTECSGAIWLEMNRLGSDALSKTKGPIQSFLEQAKNGINQALLQPGPVLIIAHGGIHWALCCWMKLEHEWVIDNCVPVHFFLAKGQWSAKKLI